MLLIFFFPLQGTQWEAQIPPDADWVHAAPGSDPLPRPLAQVQALAWPHRATAGSVQGPPGQEGVRAQDVGHHLHPGSCQGNDSTEEIQKTEGESQRVMELTKFKLIMG